MEDITIRAIDILNAVDLIVSEDTRQTQKLLNHYGIDKPQISYRDQNHHKAYPKILDALIKGSAVALVSDSGMPTISDPGFKLVSSLIEENIKIEALPGASAVTTAIAASGLPTDKFSFIGFLPRKETAAKKMLKTYGELDCTLIVFESPYRVLKTLTLIDEALQDRKICVAKELSKIHEAYFRGTVKDVLPQLTTSNLKGEFVILISKKGF